MAVERGSRVLVLLTCTLHCRPVLRALRICHTSVKPGRFVLVDQFVVQLEHEVLEKLIQEERAPIPETAFLSAQSQMRIFAAYEIIQPPRYSGRNSSAIRRQPSRGQNDFRI